MSADRLAEIRMQINSILSEGGLRPVDDTIVDILIDLHDELVEMQTKKES